MKIRPKFRTFFRPANSLKIRMVTTATSSRPVKKKKMYQRLKKLGIRQKDTSLDLMIFPT
jgi:hypothetical protein